ncbi:hypothetical protein E2553_06900 [Paraburkholderia dipogonis]|uniref:Uncharacterized protein n=1 Tax=Paraburkholderia dipogonis TaxID=1211383 RepID=A0A4Y8N531_9BURK|nr:hypothetical protein [Paraburkholderia dipogonis]TFE44771.1 hypothetical protein E2553_06900 [Paraburkholderia dipogonis]
MEWMKPKFVEHETVIEGSAATNLAVLYGTYKVLGSQGHNSGISSVKLIKSEKGNPIIRFYDKGDREIGLGFSPTVCAANTRATDAPSYVVCGKNSILFPQPWFLLAVEPTGRVIRQGNAIFGYKEMVIEKGNYSMYFSWGKDDHGADYALQRVE